jgi:hypothetical protein
VRILSKQIKKMGGTRKGYAQHQFFFYSQNKAHFVTFPLPQSSRSHDEGPLPLSQAGKKHSHLCCRKQASGGTHLLHYRAPVMELIRLNRRELVVFSVRLDSRVLIVELARSTSILAITS